MLRKFKIYVFLLLTFTVGNQAFAQAFSPTPQQIEQFTNMPRAQQEALARQLGIDLADFEFVSQGGNDQGSESNADAQVQRNVDEQHISESLSKQSAAEELSAELKPFGYSLFSTPEDMEEGISFAPSDNTPVPADYVMGPGDSINVHLYGNASNQFELFVNNEGAIQVPELGPMSIVGLTYQQLKAQLTEKYKQQVIGVTPHITMGKLRTIQIYLVGEAYRPGGFTLSSLSTITHALFATGGVSEIGSLRNIQLKRGGKMVVNFDLYDLLVFGNTEKDMRLQQGDVIFIPTVQKLVSIDGNIRRPAIYETKGSESLEDIISMAGGVLPNGAMDMIQIARKTPQSGLQVKTVNLLERSDKSFSLLNGDYINIPDANDEFSNAIVVTGAFATPGMIQWRQGLSLSSLINNNSLLNGTDLDYALVVRRNKFATQSEIIQFEPGKVLSRLYDLELQKFDQLILFNRLGSNNVEDIEKDVTDGDLKYTQDNLKSEQGNYLQELEDASFTNKQLLLKETKTYSRKELLAPIIARLKDEGTQQSPVKLAEIVGQVKYPGVYPISRDGKIKHLIIAGGGLIESAYVNRAELSRSQIDINSTFSVQHISINLIDALLGESAANQPLVSKDTLSVLRMPEWYDNRKVELIGEVVFPGTYQINKNESLVQIIKRAGGFNQDASIRAAIFTREELKERERFNLDKTVETLRQQIITSNVSGSQSVKTVNYEDAQLILDELLSIEPVGRLVIDLSALVKGNTSADIKLKDGDKLYIPNISPAVSVIGEVFVPTTHMLDESISLEGYIEQSGGFTERADDSNIYIVKANGSVKIPPSSFWFDGESIMLEAGDTIVVPRDTVNYERLGLWQTTTQIFYQTVIALVAIGRL
jgi:protein involved in polysaccharide export with SLBB domain